MKKIFFVLILQCFISAVSAAEDTNAEKGITPNISDHYQAQPVVYHFEKMPVENMNSGISRQYLYGAQSQIVKWYFKKGSEVPMHHHVNEQITWIVSGAVNVYSQGKVFVVKAGDVIIIPSNVPHRFVALEDTIDIDYFTPARQDWIDNTAAYIKK
ncbi:hypothetical protein AYO45_01055 [Gammaproteobacteria bacterium SCGC AG-212-F23]|nr:hypothetical protein AYO45_01055 [Gammaproteobacteria bacterium SCGC AG-212-F23]